MDAATHRELAREANNSTWEFLSLPMEDLTEEQSEEMTRRAYAAAYHWARAEGRTAANDARAEWLLSRVWTARREGALALHHGARCLEICNANGLADFDLAYAHESIARALACLASLELDAQLKDVFAERAALSYEAAAAVHVAEPEDKNQVDSDLASEPWFGLSVKK